MVPQKNTRILIVAGEASGDAHAARLVAALRSADPGREFEVFGSTGPQMRSEGVETVVSADQFSVVGVPEVVRALPMFLGALKNLKRAVAERRPDVAILVDFPEFNLKLAKALKASGIKVVYYISPQLWAWRKYRIRTIRRHVDLLISILPFEKDWYEENGVGHVVFAGNPTVTEMRPAVPRTEFRRSHGFDDTRPLLALLPGSRHKEVVRILPRLLLTAKAMRERDVSLQFVVAMSRLRTSAEVSESFRRAGLREDFFGEDLKIVFGETVDALGASDVSAVTSGTATLETAVIGTPMAIVYCSSKINYALLKPLIDVEHIGLVNLIAGRRLATELLQDDFTPEALSAELFRLLDRDVNQKMREELREVTESLKGQDASLNAARAVLGVLD